MNNKPQYVWAAIYNPCIYESANGVVSLHRTRENARKIVRKVKKKIRKSNRFMEKARVTKMYILP